MDRFFLFSSLFMVFLMLLCLYRAIKGPTVFDRIIGAGFIGTKTVILLVLIGFLYKRVESFLDLALAYSILNFIGTIAVTRYFIHRGAR